MDREKLHGGARSYPILEPMADYIVRQHSSLTPFGAKVIVQLRFVAAHPTPSRIALSNSN